MGLETAATIAQLNANWPLGTDPRSQGDDHLRLVKAVMKGDAASLAAAGPQLFSGALIIGGSATVGVRIAADGPGHIRRGNVNLHLSAASGAVTLRVGDVSAPVVAQAVEGAFEAPQRLRSLGTYDATTTAAANLVVLSGLGNFVRSTSSGAYKADRVSVSGQGAAIDALMPVSFRSTLEADEGRRFTGFVAEEVAAVWPEAASDEGTNYDVRALVALLWAEVRILRTRVAALEA